jgi:curved DNA-binding protein CbpA
MNELRSFHEQDFYQLLEVGHDATQDEIEAAYERLKTVFDSSSSATYMLFGDDESDVMRQMLEEAYNTLSDQTERERYDDKLGISRKSAAQSTLATSVTSTTTPIVTAAIVDDADVVHDAPAVETRAPFVGPITPLVEEVAEAPRQDLVSSPSPRDDENMEYSGGVLMRVRESKGVPLEAIAQRTKITLTHLRAIEANQYDKLPARVYVRGFVAQYAKFLGLNAERVCASYLAIYDRFVQAKTTP